MSHYFIPLQGLLWTHMRLLLVWQYHYWHYWECALWLWKRSTPFTGMVPYSCVVKKRMHLYLHRKKPYAFPWGSLNSELHIIHPAFRRVISTISGLALIREYTYHLYAKYTFWLLLLRHCIPLLALWYSLPSAPSLSLVYWARCGLCFRLVYSALLSSSCLLFLWSVFLLCCSWQR